MFMLIFDWCNEDDNSKYEQEIIWCDTKEELLEKYKYYKEYYKHLPYGRLILSAGVNYSWADIERLF